jgi:membrane protein YqaA with SNARE-associated domain
MISCLIIYFKTNEIYKLTSHKGIKYFGMTFLAFASAYFLRFFSKILFLGLILLGTRPPPREFLPLTTLLLLYSGFMATFYLLYALSSKRLGKILPETTDILHVMAIILSSIILFLNIPIIFIGIILALLFYLLFVGYSDYINSNKKKGLPQFYVVYFLLILFSMFNIIDILIPDVFGIIQILIYIFSISLFLFILYKFLKILNVELNGKQKKQTKDNIRHIKHD